MTSVRYVDIYVGPDNHLVLQVNASGTTYGALQTAVMGDIGTIAFVAGRQKQTPPDWLGMTFSFGGVAKGIGGPLGNDGIVDTNPIIIRLPGIFFIFNLCYYFNNLDDNIGKPNNNTLLFIILNLFILLLYIISF